MALLRLLLEETEGETCDPKVWPEFFKVWHTVTILKLYTCFHSCVFVVSMGLSDPYSHTVLPFHFSFPLVFPSPPGIYATIGAIQFTLLFRSVWEFFLLQFLLGEASSSFLYLTCPVPPGVQYSMLGHHHCRICEGCQRSKIWDWSRGWGPFLHWPEGRETSVSACNR